MRALTVLSLLLVGCDPTCDPASVRAALEDAQPGDVVEIGVCELEGPFVVPAGVTLRGQGEDVSAVGGWGGAAVTLGSGAALEDIGVRVNVGFGVEARSVESFALRRVTLVGPVTRENADRPGPEPTPEETGTHGIVAVDGGTATIEDVTVRGLGLFGAVFEDTNVDWRGGEIAANRETGLMASGGTITLADLRIADTFETANAIPSYGAVFRGGAIVSTERLLIERNEGYGAIHDGVTATHFDLRGEGNAQPALWAQSSPAFTLRGASVLEGNGLAGVVAVLVDEVEITGAEIRDTSVVTRVVGSRGVEVGDGIHLDLASTAGLRLDALRLIDNERAGLLIQARDGVVDSAAIGAITVSATGAGLGAIAQSETALIAPGAWDASVVREGATISNDASLVDPIDVVGAVAPMFFPTD